MPKHRYFQFFPEHWTGDVALRMCSAAARGLWIDMLCEMHSAQPYGHLTTSTGVPITTVDQLSRIVGETPQNVKRWLGELESAQVFSRTEDGVIFSRRMVRDASARARWREQWHGREREENGQNSSETLQKLSGDSNEPPLVKGKGKGKIDTANAVSKTGAKAPGKNRRVRPEPDLAPPFDAETEPIVAAFLAVVAAKNTSGTITAGREQTLRREIHARIAELGIDAMQFGLRECIARDVENVNYAVACAKGRAKKSPALFDDEPEREYAILDDLEPPEDLYPNGIPALGAAR